MSSWILLNHPLAFCKYLPHKKLLSFENYKSCKAASCDRECCPFYFRNLFLTNHNRFPQQSYHYRSSIPEVFLRKGVLKDAKAISTYAILVSLLLILKLPLSTEILLCSPLQVFWEIVFSERSYRFLRKRHMVDPSS